MTATLMKCGHVAMGHTTDGKPICPVCVGIYPGAEIVEDNPPDLTGRKAICPYCKATKPSDLTLPFFGYQPTKPHDDYYCGCFGWD